MNFKVEKRIPVVVLLLSIISIFYTSRSLFFLTTTPTEQQQHRIATETFEQQNYNTSKEKDLEGGQSTTTIKKPLCQRAQLRDGQWIKVPNSTAPYHSPSIRFSPNCDRRMDGTGFDPYQWQQVDSSCEFQKGFNTELFCDLMQNAVILFIGDSVTYEQYASLVFLLGGKASEVMKFRTAYKDLSLVQNFCGDKNTTLVFRFSHYLNGINRFLKETFPTVLVMNRGAHYQPDGEFIAVMDQALRHVHKWQQDCAERNLPCPFFWRTTTPGHANCEKFKQPENNITIMEDHVARNPVYNWENFQHQNQLALQKLQKASSQEVVAYEVIDGYEIGIRRPDDHIVPGKDCLHSCNPGAADAYNRVLLHYLRMQRTPEDISRVMQYTYPWNRTSNIIPKSSVVPGGMDVDWDDPTPYLLK